MGSDNKFSSDKFEVDNMTPHCAVVVILDTSHSMWGKGLTDMMNALNVFHKTIRQNVFSDSQIDIATVGMGDQLVMLEEFIPIGKSQLFNSNIRPKGNTPLGGALDLAQQALAKNLQHYRENGISFVTPQLILISDGKSSDDYTFAAKQICEDVTAGRLLCRAIAIGESPDRDVLMQIAHNEVYYPGYGELRGTFQDIGQQVSQTYEAQVCEVLMLENNSRQNSNI